MQLPLARISLTCFGASYLVALGMELIHLLWPRPIHRLLGLGFGLAGLLAQTLYLAHAFSLAGEGPPLSTQLGSTIFLSWILVIFYVYGSVHHWHQAWGVFVLPLVLGLIGLAALFPLESGEGGGSLDWFRGERFWSLVHSVLLALAAVGVCVAFVASVMYLIQMRRLRAKVLPQSGLKLLSLERLEKMNRRAVTLTFPLLTAGVLVGVGLLLPHLPQLSPWTDLRVLGAGALWLVFAILLYLRYGYHVRGRRVALLTIVAFCLLVFTLVVAHSGVRGGNP